MGAVRERLIVERRFGGRCLTLPDHAGLLNAAETVAFDAVMLQPTDEVPVLGVLARFRDVSPSTRLLLCTGHTPLTLLRMGIDPCAFDGFLQKPLSAQDLASLLDLPLSARHTRSD